MTAVIRAGEGRRLALPGRAATELVSGAQGGYGVTVRRVTIPPEGVPEAGRPGTGPAAPRGPHRHEGSSEVIVILAGTGEFETADGAVPVGPGDLVVVSPGEAHRTRNTGPGDLVSLCFFAVPDLAAVTTELPPLPVPPQAPGRTPRQRCPGAEDQPPDASEAPAREAEH